MKNIKSSRGALLIVFSFLFAILMISSSCNKSSYNSLIGMTGNTGGTGGTGGPGANEVFIQGNAFNPVTITVTAGTTITWTNKDAIAHTVTSKTSLFDSGNIAANGTFSFTFASAGTFSYYCAIHPSMIASVVAN